MKLGGMKDSMKDSMKDNSKRLYWVDLLRILATLAVIGLHICSTGIWYDTDVSSSVWIAVNFYASLSKWCVPVFVMISGSLFLTPTKEITISSIYTKYVPRLVVAFVIWSILYIIAYNLNNLQHLNTTTVKELGTKFVTGHYHMWFIYMIIGLYMITPPLKKMISNCDKKMIEYFLLLWIIFSILIPTIRIIPNTDLVGKLSQNMGMGFVTNFVGYYVLGYYLSIIKLTKKTKWILCLCGFIGGIATVGISTALSLSSGLPNRSIHGNSAVNVALMAIGVFSAFRIFIPSLKLSKFTKVIISELSNNCFGIYLSHAMFIPILARVGINLSAFHPILSVPAVVVSVFFTSYIFTWIIRRFKVGRSYLS